MTNSTHLIVFLLMKCSHPRNRLTTGTVRSVVKKFFTLESVSKVMVVTYCPHIRCLAMTPRQILISPRVLMKVENAVKVEPIGEFELKGIRRPLAAYNVLGVVRQVSDEH